MNTARKIGTKRISHKEPISTRKRRWIKLAIPENVVWCGTERCEERDASGNVVSQFFGLGQKTGGNSFYYNRDHLGSIREVTNSTGAIVTQVSYSPWGEPTLLQGSTLPDFGYAGYYNHPRSGLNLTLYRAYSPSLGRWLSRDPLGESAGVNLYGYVGGNPVSLVDPLGLYQYGPSSGQPQPSSWDPAKAALVKQISERLDLYTERAILTTNAIQHARKGSMTEAEMGTMIDVQAKFMAASDKWLLKNVKINCQGAKGGGPDFESLDPSLRVWWDITTEDEWKSGGHQRKYDVPYGYGIWLDYHFVDR